MPDKIFSPKTIDWGFRGRSVESQSRMKRKKFTMRRGSHNQFTSIWRKSRSLSYSCPSKDASKLSWRWISQWTRSTLFLKTKRELRPWRTLWMLLSWVHLDMIINSSSTEEVDNAKYVGRQTKCIWLIIWTDWLKEKIIWCCVKFESSKSREARRSFAYAQHPNYSIWYSKYISIGIRWLSSWTRLTPCWTIKWKNSNRFGELKCSSKWSWGEISSSWTSWWRCRGCCLLQYMLLFIQLSRYVFSLLLAWILQKLYVRPFGL